MGRNANRNMQSHSTNKIGIQCICLFYSQEFCYDARPYDHKNHRINLHSCALVLLSEIHAFFNVLVMLHDVIREAVIPSSIVY